MTEFLFVFFGGICLLAAGFGGFFLAYWIRKWDRKVGLKKIGPSTDSALRDWAVSRGYEFTERDDSWLELATRPPLRLNDDIPRANGELLHPTSLIMDFHLHNLVTDEQTNDVIRGSRSGREFIVFSHGYIERFYRRRAPRLRTVIATKFECEVPYLLVAKRTWFTSSTPTEPNRLESPPGDEHHVAFGKDHQALTSHDPFKYEVLTKEFTDWLQRQEVFYPRRNLMAFVIDNGWLYLLHRKPPEAEQLDAQLDFLMALAAKLDEQVRFGINSESRNL